MTHEQGGRPTVSVILPAYNVERYIDRSIKSVQEQSLSDIEILIVDDGSSDGTRESILRLAEGDTRIRPIFHSVNQGVSAARNSAIAAATGKWVAMVDPDDWIAPDRLETLVTLADDRKADAVGDNQVFVDPKDDQEFGQLFRNGQSGVWQLSAAEFIANDLPEMIGFGVLKLLIRKSFLDQHDLKYRTDVARGEDCLFYCECFSNGAKIFLTADPFYFYRVNREGSATNLTLGMPGIRSVAQVHEIAKEIFSDVQDPRLHKALAVRGQLIDECLQYRNVVTPLKNRQFFTALSRVLSKPTYIPPVARRIMNAAWARYQKTS